MPQNKTEYDKKYKAVEKLAKRINQSNNKITYQEAKRHAQKVAHRHDSKK